MSELQAARNADHMLQHYIITALRAAGVNVDSDTYAELDGLIEYAIQEAVQVAVREALKAIEGGEVGR